MAFLPAQGLHGKMKYQFRSNRPAPHTLVRRSKHISPRIETEKMVDLTRRRESDRGRKMIRATVGGDPTEQEETPLSCSIVPSRDAPVIGPFPSQ